ncbi:3-deoxy-manno-octulosonate cytidylyltransferase [Ensifer aridi]|uniref:3-deoxy-manno-octulosonate cytidylyltransferase n=1 Tax=Ensifer aridi TaxID=1708715 RepID=UPI00047A2CE4|nr:3-deoxy-manno-octulosonate cytidylyltransferase [Ensifer aridi]
MPNKQVIIIPARFASTRFPGKPLVELNGKAAILHTVDAARKVKNVDGIYVATDDTRIADVVESYGCSTLLTSEACQNGTERVAEATDILGLHDDDLVVNLQGDAPLTPPEFVRGIFAELERLPEADVVTPAIKCGAESYARIVDDIRQGRIGATTAVFDVNGRALYFSKALIPAGTATSTLREQPVYHHLGLYGYRVRCLRGYADMPMGPLERSEKLEQLRFLENGRSVFVFEVEDDSRDFWELNNCEDVVHLERALPAEAADHGMSFD